MEGMDLIRSQRGLSAKVARALGITTGAVAQWDKVPTERVVEVEAITGIARHLLRPDLHLSPVAAGEPAAFLPTPLTGASVSLIPLDPAHHDALIAAATDGALWQIWYTGVPNPAAMAAEIARRLAMQQAGTMAPFTVLAEPGGHVVGMTSYMNIDTVHRRVEIGSTWVAQRVQRTSLNTEAKLLLLTHAFDTLYCIAVEFRTHFLNQQSRRAIERLGAKLDGVLRCHQRAKDGTLRDTCVYSITAAEWPAIRSHLQWKLSQPR